ncbi:general substrate transporter [Trichoderma novae-zelandiae]
MKWPKAPPFYVWASLAASSVPVLFGMDTGNIGPVTTMPAFRKTFGDFSPTVHGVLVSSVLISGAFTALIAGILAHRFGQVRIFSIGSFVFGVGAAVQSSSSALPAFIVGRLIQGIGEGLFVSNVWVQVSEMSPTRVRGTMTALPQFSIVVGVVAGFFICYGTSRLGPSASLSWRLPLAISAALGFLLSGTYWLVPASPRWLLDRGRVDEARDVLIRLGFDDVEREKLLEESVAQGPAHDTADETLWQGFKQTFVGFKEAFSAPFRARTIFGCFIMGMQQLAGIDGVFYYAPILFQKAGLSGEQASFLASGVSALAILGVTIPATFLADKWGRRTSSLLGGVLITTLMLLMGSLYAADKVHADRGAGKWVVIVSIYLFAIVFNGTWAIGFRTFLMESLPRKTRSSASSLAQSANWFSNYLVALITPVLIAKSTFGAYYLFAFSSLLTTVVVALRMVETRGHSLEEIEQRYVQSRGVSTGMSLPMMRIRRVQVQAAQ